jgi:hypothetical protein
MLARLLQRLVEVVVKVEAVFILRFERKARPLIHCIG